jgi:hypothetical protein
MINRLRASAWFLALVAIMLRAALPDGWMPVADGASGTRLVICTGHGPLTDRNHSREQTPISGHETGICPFAAAMHVSSPAFFALFFAPTLSAHETGPAAYRRTAFAAQPYGNHTPRAPPFPA